VGQTHYLVFLAGLEVLLHGDLLLLGFVQVTLSDVFKKLLLLTLRMENLIETECLPRLSFAQKLHLLDLIGLDLV
jgi:hypothetical protein